MLNAFLIPSLARFIFNLSERLYQMAKMAKMAKSDKNHLI